MALRRLAFLFILGFLITACVGQTSTVTQAVIKDTLPATEALTREPVSTEAPSPTPWEPGVVWLIVPAGADAGLAAEMETSLHALVGLSGMTLEKRVDWDQEKVSVGLRAVVALEPLEGIEQAAAANPMVIFLYATQAGMAPQRNLAILRLHPAWQGFMAGYIAAVTTEDWRTGALTLSGSVSGALHRDSFLTGVRFFCGICRPLYPPYAGYPIYYEFTAGNLETEAITGLQVLLDQGVKTLYLPGEASGSKLMEKLSSSSLRVIGTQAPVQGVENNWLATVRYELAEMMAGLLPKMLSGGEGEAVDLPLTVVDVNAAVLTVGRMRLVEQTLTALQDGFINPIAVP